MSKSATIILGCIVLPTLYLFIGFIMCFLINGLIPSIIALLVSFYFSLTTIIDTYKRC